MSYLTHGRARRRRRHSLGGLIFAFGFSLSLWAIVGYGAWLLYEAVR